MKLSLSIFLLTLASGIAVSQAGTQEVPVRTANDVLSVLKGKPLYLRGLWDEHELTFSASGQPEGNYHPTSFTLSGFDLKNAQLDATGLRLEGNAVGLEFDESKTPHRVTLLEKKGWHSKPIAVAIHIHTPADGDFHTALQAIFTDDLAEIAQGLPSWWKPFAHDYASTKSPASDTKSVPGQPRTKNDVIEPKLIKNVDPQFTNAARSLKYSGETEIYMFIEKDGTPSHITIAKPCGLGLDEQAVYAVSQYRFSPATKDGEPVKVDMYVDVNFKIF